MKDKVRKEFERLAKLTTAQIVEEARKEDDLSPALVEIINRLEKVVFGKKNNVPADYDPNFGDHKVCICTHIYYRHFDMLHHMDPCKCKYCGCEKFELKV